MTQECKDDAKRLYVRENKDIDEIAKLLKVNKATIYRWKRDDGDWDEKRNLWDLSPAELEKIYMESVKELVITVKEDPRLMLDSKVADAMSKHISNLKKMNPGQLYLGAATDLLKVIDDYLKSQDKKLRDQFFQHFEGIRTAMISFVEKKF